MFQNYYNYDHGDKKSQTSERRLEKKLKISALPCEMKIMSWSQIPQDISNCSKSFLMRNLCLSELNINSNANNGSSPLRSIIPDLAGSLTGVCRCRRLSREAAPTPDRSLTPRDTETESQTSLPNPLPRPPWRFELLACLRRSRVWSSAWASAGCRWGARHLDHCRPLLLHSSTAPFRYLLTTSALCMELLLKHCPQKTVSSIVAFRGPT